MQTRVTSALHSGHRLCTSHNIRPLHSKVLFHPHLGDSARRSTPCMRSFLETQLTKIYFRLKPRAHSSMSSSVVEQSSTEMEITRVPCLSDNYAWLLHEPKSERTAIVDPSESAPVVEALQKKGVELNYVLNTHHHWDHTGGNLELKQKYGCTIVGPEADRERIPGIDVALKEGDEWDFGELKMRVFDTPGHTKGHISLYFPAAASVFTGDTLFLLGCGRLFEGNPNQMWTSLSKIKELPSETNVYCGHEYTEANAKWAITEEPANEALIERKKRIDEMRAQGLPTVPATLAEELATNPFMRAATAEAFGTLRRSKDNF